MIIFIYCFYRYTCIIQVQTGFNDLFSIEALCFFSSNFRQCLILVFTFSNVHYTNKKNNLDYFKDLTDILNILTQHSYILIWTSRKDLINAKLRLRLCDSVDHLVSFLKQCEKFWIWEDIMLFNNQCLYKNIVIFYINVCSIDTNSCSFYI